MQQERLLPKEASMVLTFLAVAVGSGGAVLFLGGLAEASWLRIIGGLVLSTGSTFWLWFERRGPEQRWISRLLIIACIAWSAAIIYILKQDLIKAALEIDLAGVFAVANLLLLWLLNRHWRRRALQNAGQLATQAQPQGAGSGQR